jgi:hypothetical protein
VSAEIVALRGTSAADIPGSLRQLADEFERGEHENVQFVAIVAVTAGAGFATYAFGECSPLEAAGAFAMAVRLV